MGRLPTKVVGIGVNPVPKAVDPNETSGLADAFGESWLGSYGDALDVERQGWHQADVDFDPRKHIPKGYEPYANAFMVAESADQIPVIKQNIDDQIARRARRDARGTTSTVLSDVGAAVLDPTNFLGLGELHAGGRVVSGIVRGAADNAAVAGLQEGMRQGTDPNARLEDSVDNVLVGTALGGVIGGVAGKVASMRDARRAAGKPDRVVQPTRTNLGLPVSGFPIGDRFGRRARPSTTMGHGSAEHMGVDIKTPRGTPLKAQANGTVTEVTSVATGGKNGIMVRVSYGPGIEASYLHLDGAQVKPGDNVVKGQLLGRTGATGNVSGPHLHYQLKVNGKPVDPLTARVGVTNGPVAVTDDLAGISVPDSYEVNGRGIPVVIGPTGSGTIAAYRAGKSASEIADEIVPAVHENRGMVDQPDAPRIDYDTLIPENERFNAEGRPWSKSLLLAEYDDRLAKAEKAAARGDTTRDAAWLTQQRALVEDAYRGTHTASDSAFLDQQARQGENGPRPARYEADPYRDAQKTLGQQSALVDWFERALAKHGAPDQPLTTKGRPYSRAWLETGLRNANKALDEAQRVLNQGDGTPRFDEGDDATFRNRDNGEPDNLDPDALELWRADREKEREDWFGYEDQLPFGNAHFNGMPEARDGEHIAIDLDAAAAAYSTKPWMTPTMEGVDPLPADAFTSVRHWIDFVVAHEVEHAYNRPMAGEAEAAYENRIVQRALELVNAERGSFAIERNAGQKAALAFTPMQQVANLVPDPAAQIHASIAELASDGSVFLARNAAGGASTRPGGSVFQRAHRWLYGYYEIRQAIRAAYLQHLGIGTGREPRILSEAMIVGQRLPFVGAGARGQLTLNEFRREVTRAQLGFTDVPEHAVAAANAMNDVMVRVEKAAREQGLFAGQRENRILAARKQSRIDRLESDLRSVHADDPIAADYRELIDRLRAEVEDLHAASAEPVMPFAEDRYYHRVWDKQAAEEGRDQLLAILEEGYRRVNHPNPRDAALGAYDTIILDPAGAFDGGGRSPSALKHRSIPVSNKDVFDFIVQDPETVSSVYLRRMGAAIEMARSFGDSGGLDEVDALHIDLRRRGLDETKAREALQTWMDMRDRVAGGFHGKDPLSLDNRAARALLNAGNLFALGKVIKSQVSDVAKFVMVQGWGAKRALTGEGPAGLLQAFMAHLSGDVNRFNIGGPAKLSGEAMELALARAVARQIEADDAIIVSRETSVERALASAQAPFFTANLLMPVTVILKEAGGLIAAHNILEDAKLVAAAIHAGQVPDAMAIKRLGRSSIDTLDAQLLAQMPTERGSGQLHLANVMAWEGEQGARARDLLLGAVNGEVRRTVLSPGPLDRPKIFDGIFDNAAGRDAAWARVEELSANADAAKEQLINLRGVPDDAPERLAAAEIYRQARADLNAARRALGRAGRREVPLARIPLQMKSFSMSSGPKTLYGLMGEGERNQLGGMVALMLGGLVAARWKMSDRQWEESSVADRMMAAFDLSGMGAIFMDIGRGVDSLIDLGFDKHLLPNNERDPNDEHISDEIGAFSGPALGSIARLIESVSGAKDAGDYWAAARQLPSLNIAWLQEAIDMTVTTFTPPDTHEPVGPDAPVIPHPVHAGSVMLEPEARLDQDFASLPDVKVPATVEEALAGNPTFDARVQEILSRKRKRKPHGKRVRAPRVKELL